MSRYIISAHALVIFGFYANFGFTAVYTFTFVYVQLTAVHRFIAISCNLTWLHLGKCIGPN